MKEILDNVSACHLAPMKYKKVTYVATGEETMLPFCCICEQGTIQVQVKLSAEQKFKNKQILFESIFPGISKIKP